MRTVLQALRESIEPRVIQTGPLELSESESSSTCPMTKLERAGQAIALRFDDWRYKDHVTIPTNRWLFPLFDVSQGRAPMCRSCDYVVFHTLPRRPDVLFVLLFELKSKSGRGARVQLRNGKLIADYILSVIRLHGEVSRWPAEICFRGIVLAPDARNTRGGMRAPARADYITDDRLRPDLWVTSQRPGSSFSIEFFCA